MGQFAEEQIANLQVVAFPTLAELKAHVYALGSFMKRDPVVSRSIAMDLWDSSKDISSLREETGRSIPNQALFGTAGQSDQRSEPDGEPRRPPVDGRSAAGVRRFASLSTIGEQGEPENSGAQYESPGFSCGRDLPHNEQRRPGEQPSFVNDSSPEVQSPMLGAYVRTGRYRSPGDPARSTPGERSDRPSEATDVVNAVALGMKNVVDSMMEKFKEIQGPNDEDGISRAQSEKFQAISHMDFKTVAPTIRDDEADMDGHDRQFDVMISNYAHGRRKPRAIDTLHKYAFSFKEGSTRRKVYDKAMRTAIRKGRIPAEAAEVLAEIRAEVRTFIWEAEIQKDDQA